MPRFGFLSGQTHIGTHDRLLHSCVVGSPTPLRFSSLRFRLLSTLSAGFATILLLTSLVICLSYLNRRVLCGSPVAQRLNSRVRRLTSKYIRWLRWMWLPISPGASLAPIMADSPAGSESANESGDDGGLTIRIPNPKVYMARQSQWKGRRGKPRCDHCRLNNLKVCSLIYHTLPFSCPVVRPSPPNMQSLLMGRWKRV